MSSNSERISAELADLRYVTSPFVAPEQQGGVTGVRFPCRIEDGSRAGEIVTLALAMHQNEGGWPEVAPHWLFLSPPDPVLEELVNGSRSPGAVQIFQCADEDAILTGLPDGTASSWAVPVDPVPASVALARATSHYGAGRQKSCTKCLRFTGIISNAEKPQPSTSLIEWMARQRDDDLFVASLTIAEIWRGILELPSGRRREALVAWFAGGDGPQSLFAGRVLSFDDNAGLIWARLMAEGSAAGRPRSALDMIPAAVAEANDCMMVTDNDRDFWGLQLFNPLRNQAEAKEP